MTETALQYDPEVSPLDTICEEAGWSIPKLAAASGVQIPHIYNARNGAQAIPRKLLAFLNETGYDVEELGRRQEEFLKSKRQALTQELKSNRAAEMAATH